MIVSYSGNLLFGYHLDVIVQLVTEWVNFIKSKPPDILDRLGVAYECFRSRHEIPKQPGRVKSSGYDLKNAAA